MTDDVRQPLDAAKTSIVLFDGTCGLCEKSVQFIIHHDHAGRFRFAPLQSDIAIQLLQKHGLDPQIDTVVLIEGDQSYTKSTAALKIALDLDEPWPLAGLLGFVPIDWRDSVYEFICRHRRQWFKSPDACSTPPIAVRERFLA